MKKIRYGIMGAAKIADRFAGGVNASGNGAVTAVASRDIERAEEKARSIGAEKWYGSYEELVADEEIDVIYIPTINAVHRENAELALLAGKHVLVEKPMTLSEKDTESLFQLAEEKGLFIMEAQKSVFLPVTEKARKTMEDGVIGRIRHLDYTISMPQVDFAWFYEPDKGGGALYGNAGYVFTHAMHLLGSPMVDVTGTATLSDKNVDLQCAFTMKAEKDILISAKITTLFSTESSLIIHGDRGSIKIKDFWKARNAVISVHGEMPEVVSMPVKFEMQYEAEHVSDCIMRGIHESPVMTREMSVKTAAYTDALYRQFLNFR